MLPTQRSSHPLAEDQVRLFDGTRLAVSLAAGTSLNSLLSGLVAGATEASITYPFEYAKTRVQLHGGGGARTSVSPFRVLRDSVASEGVRSIYKGCNSLIVGTALKASVRFFTFDAIKARLVDQNGNLSAGGSLLAGMLAGAAESVLAVTPTERIKTAVIDDAKGSKRFRSTPHAIGLIIKEEGIAGIYRGLVSTTIKQCATSAVRMGSYSMLKQGYRDKMGSQPSSVVTFFLGSIAGTITVYATQPFDSLKTRAQGTRSENMLTAFRSIVRQHGFKGLWRGSTMRLGRLMLSGGIVFSAYEHVSVVLHRFSGV